ncbi:hypothetical protein OC845_004884 [Tilletia horrida]|nr:hypothetical protein OC845_004884 [Tilletia horrida]
MTSYSNGSGIVKVVGGWTAVPADDPANESLQLPADHSTGSLAVEYELSQIQSKHLSSEKEDGVTTLGSYHQPSDTDLVITYDQVHNAQDLADFSFRQQPSGAFHHRSASSSSSAGLPDRDNTAISVKRARKRLWKDLKTVAIITGGWGALVIGCVVFKMAAMAVNLRVPDYWAELHIARPQLATQFWTLIGNIIAEICLILWAMSISYLAFRAVVFSKDKVELLTIASWTELSNAGYSRSSLEYVLVQNFG